MTHSLRIAYLIFAHKNPAQLGRLLKRLHYLNCRFYIHVDAKADLNAFRIAASQVPADSIVWLSKRTAISWGDFSLSATYLSGFQFILQQRPEPDFIITLSGQDYPIATNEVLHEWLAEHLDQTILDHTLITEDSPHITERVTNYFLSIKPHRTVIYPYPDQSDVRKRLFNTALRMSGLFKLPRQLPLGHQLYFGTNWFQLKPEAARYLVDFAWSHPSYIRFAQTTFVPEEYFFHTILAQAPDAIRNTLYNHRLTFMQWDRPPGSYPIPISADELPSMLRSGKLFARKFDEQYDSHVLDQLDQYLTGVTSLD